VTESREDNDRSRDQDLSSSCQLVSRRKINSSTGSEKMLSRNTSEEEKFGGDGVQTGQK
jgi:hypothetical protein